MVKGLEVTDRGFKRCKNRTIDERAIRLRIRRLVSHSQDNLSERLLPEWDNTEALIRKAREA